MINGCCLRREAENTQVTARKLEAARRTLQEYVRFTTLSMLICLDAQMKITSDLLKSSGNESAVRRWWLGELSSLPR